MKDNGLSGRLKEVATFSAAWSHKIWLAVALIKKVARVSNMVIFLSVWACIKIAQALVELQFFGIIKFMAARLILTIIFVAIMGIFVERLIEWTDDRRIGVSQEVEK